MDKDWIVPDWPAPTDTNNVRVLNDTADFYCFFDATPHAEFLYACVRQTKAPPISDMASSERTPMV